MFFNNKFNTFFGLNLTLVYTFPMCMAWRFHFPIRSYDFKGVVADQDTGDASLGELATEKTAVDVIKRRAKEWEQWIELNGFVSIGDIYDKCGE